MAKPAQLPAGYRRRQPEDTDLYRIFQDNLETFLERTSTDGRSLPRFVVRELRAFLDCGILARGFSRVRCPTCKDDLLVAKISCHHWLAGGFHHLSYRLFAFVIMELQCELHACGVW